MWAPKFKFKDRVEITQGFYRGKTGIVVLQKFKLWPLGYFYQVLGEMEENSAFMQMITGNAFAFQAGITERHLVPAKEKMLAVGVDGALKEVK